MVMHIPEFKNNRSLYNLKLILPKYKDFYDEIMNMYPDSLQYNEKLYRYLHNIENHPICPVCGNLIPYRNSPAGYGKYCCTKCMGRSETRTDKIANTKLLRYGSKTYNNSSKTTDTMNKIYGGRGLASDQLRKKSEQTCMMKFGTDNVFKLKEFQDKCYESKLKKYGDGYYTNHKKSEQTCIDHYGVNNPMKYEIIKSKFKNTMNKKYGCDWAMQNKESVCRLSKSITEAHREGKYDVSGKKKTPSKIEKQFQQYLIDNNINYVFQYRSDEYPYLCDFYIPDYDLYIEIQGSWTHGKHPYTGSEDDLNLVNEWKNKNSKFYDQAIYVWTELDVKKREIAKNNNLRYLEIFSIKIDECVSLFENKIKKIKYVR